MRGLSVSMLLAGFAILTLAQTGRCADEPLVIRAWPQNAPGETTDYGTEKDVPRNDPVKTTRITNISHPTLLLWRPAPEKDTGTTVIVCPGGGYSYVVVDKEGSEVVRWLNSIGVTGAVLKYRTPAREGRPRHEAPAQDAQRAISLLRHRAAELKLNPDRIGIMGFSAGGHVAACASTQFEKRLYVPNDDVDQTSCRPDFSLLMYPAYLADKTSGALSPEVPVSAQTPPTFLMMTQDDGLGVESAVSYYLALKKHKVPAEMHLYPSGGHGYGMRLEPVHTASTWPLRAAEWLRAGGWLTRPRPVAER